ncbi:PREDICTED: uncharacterized protein LOC103325475 [Prunus mume]|uniref:Uncharacterized protein LOC103325475 n=1 Tax=Prunus mume TaxID=102107 RepID=A0ABM1LLB9_PRUMU|nr:PREDICTED: uncharacterized protein LOC103325475 [Prunus mume]
MNSGAELPGFYYDAEKNRYFPTKGPIPGSRRVTTAASSSSAQTPAQVSNSCRRTRVKTSKLLHDRELCGNLIASSKGRCNFYEEFQKAQVSHPVVWKYQGTNQLGDGALERIRMDVQTGEELTDTDFVLAGGADGSLSIFEVGKVGQGLEYGLKCKADRVWPLLNESQLECSEVPGHIWRPAQATPRMPSNISRIKLFGKQSPGTEDESSRTQHMLLVLRRNIYEIVTFNCTIWTADCEPDGSRAVIGTNLGAALVDLETGRASWLLRSKSDLLAQKLVHTVIY